MTESMTTIIQKASTLIDFFPEVHKENESIVYMYSRARQPIESIEEAIESENQKVQDSIVGYKNDSSCVIWYIECRMQQNLLLLLDFCCERKMCNSDASVSDESYLTMYLLSVSVSYSLNWIRFNSKMRIINALPVTTEH